MKNVYPQITQITQIKKAKGRLKQIKEKRKIKFCI